MTHNFVRRLSISSLISPFREKARIMKKGCSGRMALAFLLIVVLITLVMPTVKAGKKNTKVTTKIVLNNLVVTITDPDGIRYVQAWDTLTGKPVHNSGKLKCPTTYQFTAGPVPVSPMKIFVLDCEGKGTWNGQSSCWETKEEAPYEAYRVWRWSGPYRTKNVTLHANMVTGWNGTIPGPYITVYQWDIIYFNLISDDGQTHNFFVDFNGDGLPGGPDVLSENFSTTCIHFLLAHTSGDFNYYCLYHPESEFGTFHVEAVPVGGIWISVDKLSLLAPYIGLASTILAATVAAAIYVKRVKHRKKN